MTKEILINALCILLAYLYFGGFWQCLIFTGIVLGVRGLFNLPYCEWLEYIMIKKAH
jgi:uncharacterized ion transporter superfamily protein YfcC